MACAQHNAKIYGVHNQITWFDKDCFDVLNTQLKEMGEYAVIFGSPPWGGKSSTETTAQEIAK